MKYSILTPLLIATALVYPSQILSMEAPNDHKISPQYSHGELRAKSYIGHESKKFIVEYQDPTTGIHVTPGLNQEELTQFIKNIGNRLIIGIRVDKPIYPYKLYEFTDEIPETTKFIVTYQQKGSDEKKQTQPLTQQQLRDFLGGDHNFLIVGIENTPQFYHLED